jgi:hypothetical protein
MPVVSAMAAIQPKVPKDDLSKEERPVDFAAYNETGLHRFVTDQTIKDVFFVMLFVRLANSLSMKTFFQPDEYFQVLEPAWQMAFGADSGAWITWVSSDLPPLEDDIVQVLTSRRNGSTSCARHFTRRCSRAPSSSLTRP